MYILLKTTPSPPTLLLILHDLAFSLHGSHGVMVSTLDSESSDPSSSLGGTWGIFYNLTFYYDIFKVCVSCSEGKKRRGVGEACVRREWEGGVNVVRWMSGRNRWWVKVGSSSQLSLLINGSEPSHLDALEGVLVNQVHARYTKFIYSSLPLSRLLGYWLRGCW